MTQHRILGKARLVFGFTAGIAAFLITLGYLPAADAQEFNSRTIATYTAAQAEQGKALYAKSCASCHGQTLGGGEFASALNGMTFSNNWGGKSAVELFNYINTKMPHCLRIRRRSH
jgi:mono/diheme cytochrome c family protein